MTTVWLAWREFSRAFTRAAPGGRDFFWTACLLCLIQLLTLITISARDGVLERSVDAFLGYVSGYGVPIWTRSNIVGFGGITLISNGLVDEIRADGYEVEPFRRLYNGSLLQLPADDIWTEDPDRGGENAFFGIAAESDGPLFPAVTLAASELDDEDQLEGLWPIVLDIDQFQANFDLAAYRASLLGRIPEAYLDRVPSNPGNLDALTVIWMEMQTQHGRQLTPMRVIWGRYLGVGSDPSAFFVDRRLYIAMDAIQMNPAICADVTGGPSLPLAVGQIQSHSTLMLSPEMREELNTDFTRFVSTLSAEYGGTSVSTATREQWTPDTSGRRGNCNPWVPAPILNIHLADTSSDPDIQSEPDVSSLEILPVAEVRGFAVNSNGYSAPCDVLSPSVLSQRGTRREETPEGCIAHVSSTANGAGYNEMMIYARDRTAISELTRYIECGSVTATALEQNDDSIDPESQETLCRLVQSPRGEPIVESRLMLDEIYQDSLSRFGFLSQMLAIVSGPIGLSLLSVLTAILFVQINTLVEHRKTNYAILLSNGLSPRNLAIMIMVQLTFCVVASMAIALIMFLLLQYGLALSSQQLSINFERIMRGRDLNLLPLSSEIVAGILSVTLLFAWGFSVWKIHQAGVSRRKSIEDLLR